MAPQKNPRFTEEELRVMVEEIVKVEPRLFGALVQQTSIARKNDLWQRIVNRVNAVGNHPRTREDIRKRWNDLRGKVRAMASRHQVAVMRTGGGPPPPPPEMAPWEEMVLAILHPEGLTGIATGLDTGLPSTDTQQRSPVTGSPGLDAAPIGEDSPASLDSDNEPGPSGMSGQSTTTSLTLPTTQTTSPVAASAQQSPPSHTCVPRSHQSSVCPTGQGQESTVQTQDNDGPGVSRRGHTAPGAQAQGARASGRPIVGQGTRQVQDTTGQEAVSRVLGAYQQTQDQLGQILTTLQDTQRLQEEYHQEARQQWQAHNATMASILGEFKELNYILRTFSTQQQAPSSSQSTPLPSTSAPATGMEAQQEDPQATSTPTPAAEEPPAKEVAHPDILQDLRPRPIPPPGSDPPSELSPLCATVKPCWLSNTKVTSFRGKWIQDL